MYGPLSKRREAFHHELQAQGYTAHDMRLGPDGLYRSADVRKLWHAFTAGYAFGLAEQATRTPDARPCTLR
jgi:hypothetical protein